MNNIIKCEYEIKNDYFNNVSDYFETLNDKQRTELHKVLNYLIYSNDNHYKNSKNSLEKIEKLPFLFNNKTVIDDYKTCVEFLKTTFNIGRMWAMSYPPKSCLDFHIDLGLKRHVITFNENEMFFNYECHRTVSHEKILSYTKNLKNMINDPLKFNEYFLNDNPTNKIVNLEKNKIYGFGNCSHSFFNGTTNKNRFNIVFEIID
jgi:hypothetical protein